ncbi:uncharacterized protein LOC132628318 [Lycium barbarum]|uniref:uncharacterized protein LOC132628318 n=1 Tax=Lycium barbarum TaxID=112863 RepID=UPI00293E2174|nr:uncharacterized protein LOC132628318 [Lycium barbarum]
MSLTFIPPKITEGEKIVELVQEDVVCETLKWKAATVVYMVLDPQHLGAMERFIMAQGDLENKPKVYYHNDGYFVVRFAKEEERDMVMCVGPHMLNNRTVIIKPWTGDFNFHYEILTVIPLWIKLPNLPLNCWGYTALSKIGSALGRPLYADACTTLNSRITFARILMEMEITRPLLDKIKVQDPKGKVYDQRVWYDWKPSYCSTCLQVGHDCAMKQNHKQPVEPKNDPPPEPKEKPKAIYHKQRRVETTWK